MEGDVRMLSVRGVDVAVCQVGRGSDIVLLHGFQNDHTAWDPFVERLDLDSDHVTAFDFVGCAATVGSRLGALHDRRVRRGPGGDVRRTRAHSARGDRSQSGGATALEAAWPTRSLRALVLVAPASTTGPDFLPDATAFEALAHPTPEQQRQLARGRVPASAE